MGGGDWNDGMDALGSGGESVWLTWFFVHCAQRFAALLRTLGESDAAWYQNAADTAREAAEAAWEGDRYLRGWYGDGEALGSAASPEGRMDSLCQSFAAFCGGEHADEALTAALRELWDGERHITRLLTPPFTAAHRSPGYITGYGPGFRENGGQYTHAALFLALALLRRGRTEEGWAVLRTAMAEGRGTEYGAEPFVIPADIYTNPSCPGRAGWSWYTGSAALFLRCAFSGLLGFRLQNGQGGHVGAPALPGWEDCALRWRDGQVEEISLPGEKEKNS